MGTKSKYSLFKEEGRLDVMAYIEEAKEKLGPKKWAFWQAVNLIIIGLVVAYLVAFVCISFGVL